MTSQQNTEAHSAYLLPSLNDNSRYSELKIRDKIENRLIGPDNRLNGLISDTALVKNLKIAKQKLQRENKELKSRITELEKEVETGDSTNQMLRDNINKILLSENTFTLTELNEITVEQLKEQKR